MTSDRIEALTAGHGMLNMAVFAIANVIADEVLGGRAVEVKYANARRQPIDDILEKCIAAARSAGADGANAALLSATTLYLVGAAAQVGIPAGNRKLGATARMLAGVDRCGVAALPTAQDEQQDPRLPGGRRHQPGDGGGQAQPDQRPRDPAERRRRPAVRPQRARRGHHLSRRWPRTARASARRRCSTPWPAPACRCIPRRLRSSARPPILEIIHPDADMPEKYGPYGTVSSAVVAGREAAKTAGLPETLHVRITGEEYETGRLVGDLGLILKDVGGVSVIGMMMFDELLAIFEEGIAGFSGGPLNPPLGHICADAVLALKGLVAKDGDQEAVAARHRRLASGFVHRSGSGPLRRQHHHSQGGGDPRRPRHRHADQGHRAGADPGLLPPRRRRIRGPLRRQVGRGRRHRTSTSSVRARSRRAPTRCSAA